jgi:hypothetical protein
LHQIDFEHELLSIFKKKKKIFQKDSTYFPNNFAYFEWPWPIPSPLQTTKPLLSSCHSIKKSLKKPHDFEKNTIKIKINEKNYFELNLHLPKLPNSVTKGTMVSKIST